MGPLLTGLVQVTAYSGDLSWVVKSNEAALG